MRQFESRCLHDATASSCIARKHRENLMRKLNVHNTAAPTAYAVRHGVLAG